MTLIIQSTDIELGKIRKGDEQGTGYGNIGKNLEHRLRIDFHAHVPGWEERFAGLAAFYKTSELNFHELRTGEAIVTEIPFILPVPDLADSWSFAYEAHLSYTLAVSDEAGENWNFVREPGTMRVLVSGGLVQLAHTTPDGREYQPGEIRPVDPYEVLHKAEKSTVTPTAKGRLKMLLPCLGEIAHFELVTTSINDCERIPGQLQRIQAMCQAAGRSLVGVPLILRRRQVEIAKSYGDVSLRALEWLLSVELDPEFGQKLITELQQ